MVVSDLEYEECRRQRLEENKKRMEELNLNKLSHALKASNSPKSSPLKTLKPRVPRSPMEMLPARRSTRVADKPPPNYRELGLADPSERHIRRGGCYKRKDLLNRVYASDETRMNAIDRAEDVQSSLEPELPSFIKPMLQSHVTGGFWLGLPHHFCAKHLPKDDEMMTLEDEDGTESLSKYLAQKNGLSGGWRGFAIDHELVDGDALVFQLVKPTKFKVHIIRVNDGSEICDNEDEDGEKEEEQEAKVISKVRQPNKSAERIRKVNQSKTVKMMTIMKTKKEKIIKRRFQNLRQLDRSSMGTRRSLRQKLTVDYGEDK